VDRRAFIGTLAGGLLAAPILVKAQQPARVYRIGVLSGASPEWLAPMLDSFRKGLLDLGYTESQIVFYIRYAEGRDEILPRLVGELVSLTILGSEVAPKRLELVKELRPRATQVALLWNPDNPANVYMEHELKGTARRLGLKLVSASVRDVAEFDSAFEVIAKQRVAALIVTGDQMHQVHIGRVIDFGARNRLPAIYNIKENVLAGGLMSYGADHRELYRRAAIYVDKILKGTKPRDLPIEQPTKFELVINLKTAKALGLTIPPSLLQRADAVIE
jgi:putative ABC transport system substrate-binding protein